jgi:hypothetical protein
MRFIVLEIFRLDNVRWEFFKGETTNSFESIVLTVRARFKLTNKQAAALATDVLLGEAPEWFISGATSGHWI